MEIRVKRIFNCDKYCIGKLYLDDEYICDTLEDTDRGLGDYMKEEDIAKIKIKGKTAIPVGKYKLNLNIVSPRFHNNSFYKAVCLGKLPVIENVPGFKGILIHCGNDQNDTEGCLLVGWNKIKGKVINSRQAFVHLYSKLVKKKEIIYIKIERTY